MEGLPEDIQVNILQRLSLKDLVRLMCTSKSMFTLVTSPSLMVATTTGETGHHLYCCCESNGQQSLLLGTDPDIKSNNTKRRAITGINFHNVPIDTSHNIIGFSHGLTCFANTFNQEDLRLVVWNPFIGKCLSIQFPDIVVAERSHALGFGFDFSCTDFKVVRIGYICLKDTWLWADVYALHTGTWKKVKGSMSRPISKIVEQGVYMNGVLHWILKIYPNDYTILTYDLAKEVFREMDIPKDIVHEDLALIKLTVSGEETLAIYHSDHICKIWVMKEYGVTNSWTYYCGIDFGEEYGKVLNSWGNGNVIVSTSKGNLLQFNPSDGYMSTVYSVQGSMMVDYMGPYIESLGFFGNNQGFLRVSG